MGRVLGLIAGLLFGGVAGLFFGILLIEPVLSSFPIQESQTLGVAMLLVTGCPVIGAIAGGLLAAWVGKT